MAKDKEKALEFQVLIEKDEDGVYVASVPELPSCYTQATTLRELRKRVREAIELVLESDSELKEEKLNSPKARESFYGVENVNIRYA